MTALTRYFAIAAIAIAVFAVKPTAAAETGNGIETLNKLLEQIQKVDNYQFIFEFKEIDKKGEETWREIEFWHKAPNYLLLSVLDGKNKGALIVYNPDANKDKFFVKNGKLPMPPMGIDNPLFAGTFETEWAEDYRDLIEFAKSGSMSFKEKTKLGGREADLFEILPGKNDESITRILVWVDVKDQLLVKYQYFIGDNMESEKIWTKYSMNPGLKDKAFEIKYYGKFKLAK